MNKNVQVRRTLAMLALMAGALLAPILGTSQVGAATSGCRYYPTGRTTCTYGSGGYSTYNSYNPRTGYRSNGYRYYSPSHSTGSWRYSTPRSSGSRSYTNYRPYSGYGGYYGRR